MQQRVVFRAKGGKVVLRPLSQLDVPTLTRWTNDPKITQFVVSYLPRTE